MKPVNVIIKELREDHDLHQKDVAAYLGITQQTYSNYELGLREIPVHHIISLSEFYKVSADYLLSIKPVYRGSTNLDSVFYRDITINDVIYDIQALRPKEREMLTEYITYLKHRERTS